MAIDPVTAKLIAKAAIKAATDEEARKKIVIIILIPVISVLLILTMFTYIITHPLDFLSTIFSGNELTQVTEMHNDFSLDQNVDTTDSNYKVSYETDYSGITFSNGSTKVVYFNQADKRWADIPYGKTGTIGKSGCGPTSLAIAVSSLSGKTVDPVQISKWAYENGYRCEGNGSYHSLIPQGAKAFGLKAEGCSTSETQRIVDALATGKLVVAIMEKGHFTKGGHFIVLRGVTSEGKILVADPVSKSRSDQEWDLSLILNEASIHASAGGPFWILSR
ncbi:MAG: C39 family peptidase [Clostridia bacterium]|nr:C39 family peptidase [Clostridia bacterium]